MPHFDYQAANDCIYLIIDCTRPLRNRWTTK